MAELTFIEKSTIESFLGMRSGYVMDFSDRTFQDFVGEATGLDINSEKYHFHSNSKANRLRSFIKIEPNDVVGKLISALCDYWLAKVKSGQIDYSNDENIYRECLKIASRLKQEILIETLDALQPNSDDKDFALLAKTIKESIEKNEPEAALDRLHTFTVKYIRQLCNTNRILHDKDESLNSLFGKYVKHLVAIKALESIMAEKILKFSINIIEAFNDIRNNKSFAHDNPILNYDESILIFNNISNMVKYIEGLENRIHKSLSEKEVNWSELT